MFVYIGGVPGVGKTSFIREVVKLSQESDFPVMGMNEKSVLRELIGVTTEEEYRLLPDNIRAQARRKMVVQFYELDAADSKAIRIRDDHFAVPKGNNQYFTRPYEISDKLQVLAMIVLISTPDIIARHRCKDMAFRPERAIEDYKTITEHQNMEINTAIAQASCLNVSLGIFLNEEGKLSTAVKKTLSLIQTAVASKGGCV